MPSSMMVMMAFPEGQEENAKRVSSILAGTDPKKVDGYVVIHVPLARLEDALLLQEATT